MTILFHRVVEVTWALKTGGASVGTKVKDLRVSFKIKKEANGINSCKLEIYNLSSSTINSIKKQKEDIFVILEIGYKDGKEQLFIGEIDTIISEKKGAEIVTRISVNDGFSALNQVTMNKSYASGTDVKQIAVDAANFIKETAKTVIGSLTSVQSKKLDTGLVVSDKAANILKGIAKDQNLNVSVQDNELKFVPIGEDIGETAISISNKTGMIGVPVIRETGIEINSLIIPGLKIDRLIEVTSDIKKINKELYKIETLEYSGDNYQNDWNVKIIASDI